MKYEDVGDFLRKINKIRTNSRSVDYNIFSAIDLKYKETMHSLILASFLNPKARHGLGDTFLQLFIDQISGLNGFDFNVSNAKVKTEQFAPAEEVNGRIDIFISSEEYSEDLEDGTVKKKAIIIENKLNAGDQYHQLDRYKVWAEKEKYEFKILYLTLDGHSPSTNSTKNKDSYITISYEKIVLPWLEKCIEKAALAPDVREPLNQYRIHIANIIKQQLMKTEILDNLEAAEEIKKLYYECLNDKAIEFAKSLKIEDYKITTKCKDKNYRFWSIVIRKPEWNYVEIRFQYDDVYFNDLRYGAHFILEEENGVETMRIPNEIKNSILKCADDQIKDICKITPYLADAKTREGLKKERWPFKVVSSKYQSLSAKDVLPNSSFQDFLNECVKDIAPFVEDFEKKALESK